MKNLLFLLPFMCLVATAQDITLDHPEKPSDEELYGELLQRYRDNDETLIIEQYEFLYHGFPDREEYNGSFNTIEREMQSAMSQGLHEKGWELAYKVLDEENPFSLQALWAIAIAGRQLEKDIEEYAPYLKKFAMLIAVIKRSGDGSEERPYKVICISDEYQFLRFDLLGTQKGILQQRTTEIFDIFTLGIRDGDEIVDEEVVYFDISPSKKHMSKIFGN